MCGILAGNGKLSDTKYRGIAPQCSILCGKVLDEKGGGSLKNLLMGLEDYRNDENISCQNIEYFNRDGTDSSFKPDEVALLHKYLEYFWSSNVMIVAAAGNKGPEPMSISPISESVECICVGCNDGDYVGAGGRTCAAYSARGPANVYDVNPAKGNPLKKPDIVAPGTDIVSCCNRVYGRNNRWRQPYIAKSGTSMATPIVSGALALCLQKYPQITIHN